MLKAYPTTCLHLFRHAVGCEFQFCIQCFTYINILQAKYTILYFDAKGKCIDCYICMWDMCIIKSSEITADISIETAVSIELMNCN